LNTTPGPLSSAAMKFLFGAVPFMFFAALLAAGLVKATLPEPSGSPWLLIVGAVLFIGLMLKSCLPVKH